MICSSRKPQSLVNGESASCMLCELLDSLVRRMSSLKKHNATKRRGNELSLNESRILLSAEGLLSAHGLWRGFADRA